VSARDALVLLNTKPSFEARKHPARRVDADTFGGITLLILDLCNRDYDIVTTRAVRHRVS